MIRTLEEEVMLEIADSVVRGDDVDIAIGGDTDVDITDFDILSGEEQVLSMIDLLQGPNDRQVIPDTDDDDVLDEQALFEAVFDDKWTGKKGDYAARVKHAAQTGDEKILDKIGRHLFSNSVMIGVMTGMNASGGPVMMSAAAIGGVIGTIIGGLFADAVIDKKKIAMMTQYQTMIRGDINVLEIQKNRLKGDTAEDKEKRKNADKILTALKDADRTLTTKLAKARKQFAKGE